MTDNELILCISDLFDKKLKPIYDRLDRLEERMDRLEVRMDRLEERMDRLEERVDKLEIKLETRMDGIENKVKQLETNTTSIDTRLKKVELTLENDICPRLQNIESCYTSTFTRYQTGVEKIDAIEVDVGILKEVVRNHSEKLQRIS